MIPLALWTPNFIATWTDTPAGLSSFIDAVSLGGLFWLLWFAVCSRVALAMVLAIPFALLWPIELWVRQNHGTPISAHLVALSWETGWDEGANFFTAFGMPLALLAFAWILAYGTLLFWAWRRHIAWRGRTRGWILAIGLPLLVWANLPPSATPAVRAASTADTIMGNGVRGWGAHWNDVFPINLGVAIDQYQQQRQRLQALQTALAQRRLNATQANPAGAPKVVVLVIGESASASHWGALGYDRDTTPRLAAMRGVALFSDVVALSTATRSAVPNVLSRRPVMWPDGRVDLDAEPSIVKAFAGVGYQTHWISNQAPLGRHDTSIGLYAHGADNVLFLNPSTYDAAGNTYDEALLGPLRRALQKGGRQFFVVHLLGSHFDYGQRYPPAFDHFQPSSQSKAKNAQTSNVSAAEMQNNSYDNSIRYTDYILGEIVDELGRLGSSSMLAYFSDHGTDQNVGRCSTQAGSRRSEFAYRVPLFFWLSDSLRAEQPDMWHRLQANTGQPYTTRALYSTLLALSSIGVEGGLPAESLLHRPSRTVPRIVGYGEHLLDFDAARQKDSCVISPG